MGRGGCPQHIRVGKTPCAIQTCCPRHHNQLYFFPRYQDIPSLVKVATGPALPPIPSGKDKHPHDFLFPGHCQPQPLPKAQKEEA